MLKWIIKKAVKRVVVWITGLGILSSKEPADGTGGEQDGTGGSDPTGGSHGSGGAGGGGSGG